MALKSFDFWEYYRMVSFNEIIFSNLFYFCDQFIDTNCLNWTDLLK